jgi:hypothetical protein
LLEAGATEVGAAQIAAEKVGAEEIDMLPTGVAELGSDQSRDVAGRGTPGRLESEQEAGGDGMEVLIIGFQDALEDFGGAVAMVELVGRLAEQVGGPDSFQSPGVADVAEPIDEHVAGEEQLDGAVTQQAEEFFFGRDYLI